MMREVKDVIKKLKKQQGVWEGVLFAPTDSQILGVRTATRLVESGSNMHTFQD